jgi:hypothetical protein
MTAMIMELWAENLFAKVRPLLFMLQRNFIGTTNINYNEKSKNRFC